MSWADSAGRILAVSLLALVIGWFYGRPLEAVLLTVMVLGAGWLYQMHRVQVWLRDPEQPPPDVYGIWGELLARIRQHQRKSLEIRQALHSNLENLHDCFASMRDGVVMVDRQGVITWYNRAAEALLGLRHSGDIGQFITNLVRWPEFGRYFLAGDYAVPLEFRAALDPEVHLRIEITRFGDDERLLFIRDNSSSVLLEQQRRDFVANVSHELRTPLTVITGYLATIGDYGDIVPEPLRKPLEQMRQQAVRMEVLITDLLMLSKIESEPHGPRQDSVDMAAILREIRTELQGAYPGTPIELDVQTTARLRGDSRELYSAVINLVNNAVKYSPPGSPVTVRWAQPADHFVLSVEDRGVGIDPAHIPRITERFYRVDDSRSTHTGGTGLGLAIVKHVVAAHGGRLQIASKPGEGSIFTLIFPIGDEDGS